MYKVSDRDFCPFWVSVWSRKSTREKLLKTVLIYAYIGSSVSSVSCEVSGGFERTRVRVSQGGLRVEVCGRPTEKIVISNETRKDLKACLP